MQDLRKTDQQPLNEDIFFTKFANYYSASSSMISQNAFVQLLNLDNRISCFIEVLHGILYKK